MRQRDPQWLERIVADLVREAEITPYWLRGAEVEAALRRIAERGKAQEAAARAGEPSE